VFGPPSDLPIPISYTVTDNSGEAVSTQVFLDGVPLPSGTNALSTDLFCSLNLGILGRHTLMVQATDCAGNVGVASVTFEIVLFGNGLLEVKPEALNVNENEQGVLTAFFTLPKIADCSIFDPTFKDVVTSTLRLTALATGRQAAPTLVSAEAGTSRLVLKFRRTDLSAADGTIGTSFLLTGRFFTTTGPAFFATDEIKKAVDSSGTGKQASATEPSGASGSGTPSSGQQPGQSPSDGSGSESPGNQKQDPATKKNSQGSKGHGK
jgi:hypothetical protein